MRIEIRSGSAAGAVVELDHSVVLGRGEECDIVLDDEKASRRHARVTVAGTGTVEVEDLGSTNGTYVDGARIGARTPLRAGSTLTIGNTVLVISGDTRSASATKLATPTAVPRPAAPPASPSKLERLALGRSIRRSQRIVAIVGVAAVAAVVVVVLFLTGAIGGDDEQPTVAGVIEQATPSTVQVRRFVDAESENAGSGWVYDADQALIVTNAHVVNEGSLFAVRLGEEDRERAAEVVGVAPCEDLAVLRAGDASGLETMPLGSQADVVQGEDVVALGYPSTVLSENDRLVATEGIVSVVEAKSDLGPSVAPLPNVVQVDAAINFGNSGGPLVDLDGVLVGVNTVTNSALEVEGQNYAIGVDRVEEIVPRLADGRSLAWTGMGFTYPAADSDYTDRELPVVPGLIVERVVPGTTAEAAGFGQGPVLVTAIDGQALTPDIRSYCDLTGDLESGDVATFTIYLPGESEPRDVPVEFE
jgi:S1-C subfamily serine protease